MTTTKESNKESQRSWNKLVSNITAVLKSLVLLISNFVKNGLEFLMTLSSILFHILKLGVIIFRIIEKVTILIFSIVTGVIRIVYELIQSLRKVIRSS